MKKSLLMCAALFAGVCHAQTNTVAKKIVTVDAAITETVFLLGAGELVKAVDETSLYPPHVSALPQVGYMRALTAEGIMAVEPQLVLVSQDAGPAEALTQLRNLGVQVEVITNDYSAQSIKNMINRIGTLVQQPSQAEALITQFEQQLLATQAHKFTQRIMFVMNGGARGLMVAGQGTRAHALIELSGAHNAFGDLTGYKPLSNEAVLMNNPDVILLMHSDKNIEQWRNDPLLQHTTAAQNNAIFIIDDLGLLTFGPRLPAAIAQVQHWLQP